MSVAAGATLYFNRGDGYLRLHRFDHRLGDGADLSRGAFFQRGPGGQRLAKRL